MQASRLLLLSLFCSAGLLLRLAKAQLITQPPENVVAAQGTNATFTCRGNGNVFWEITGTQVQTERVVGLFALEKVYVPLPTSSVSQLIMTATQMNNFTRTIQCLVDPGIGVGPIEESTAVHLLVYAEPNPPSNLDITVDGLNLVSTWTEPFSLEGEEISYVIAVSNSGATMEEVTVDTPTYVFTGPTTGPRDCAEYQFSVFSKNNFSKSVTGLSGRMNIPTEPLLITKSDVQLDVSLTSGASARITFSSADPCPSYPVTSYTFNITERDTNTLTASIRHTSTVPLVVDGSNGLVPDQVYRLVIEAENSVGSTLSEEVLIYTTGLQSSTVVLELDGSITVTCKFATGAMSAGCQVTILMMDSMQEILTKNLTRQIGESQVTETMVVEGVAGDSVLLVKTAELLSGGGVSTLFFNGTVTVATTPTTVPPTTPSTTATSDVGGTLNPIPLGNTLYFIIGAVGGVILILLLLIILTICILCSARRRRNNGLYNPNDEELKNNYSYGNTPVHTGEFDNSGLHARCNTYDYRDEQLVGPLYETINDKSRMGNGASARPVPNPVYGGEIVHSGSKCADNPVYAEASEAQARARGPTLLSQVSTATDVSALNPVYSGVPDPHSPHSLSASYSLAQGVPPPPPSQSAVPQPSLGGAAVFDETKLQYATPDLSLHNGRYTTVVVNQGGVTLQQQYSVPQQSPTLSSSGAAAGGGAKRTYTNAPPQMIPTDPDTGYSTLSRGDFVEPPPGPMPIYEMIKVKDTRPPVRPDGDGVTLQTNTSYGLLLSDAASNASASPSHTPTPKSPTLSGSQAPPHSPPPTHSPPPPHSPPPVQDPPPPPPPITTSQSS